MAKGTANKKQLELICLPLVLQESLLPRQAGAKVVHREYGSSSNRVSITLSGGFHKGKQLPLPSSIIGRRLFYYLVSEVRRTGDPTIELDGSPTFLKKIGIAACGQQRKRLRTEILRLSYMNITIEHFNANDLLSVPNISVFNEIALYDFANATQLPLFGSYLTFSQPFTDAILNQPHQPISADAIKSIGSPLAIDIYLWLCRRTWTIYDQKTFSWKMMKAQFGLPKERMSRFKELFTRSFGYASEHMKTWSGDGSTVGKITSEGLTIYNQPQQVKSKEKPRSGWGNL